MNWQWNIAYIMQYIWKREPNWQLNHKSIILSEDLNIRVLVVHLMCTLFIFSFHIAVVYDERPVAKRN